MHTHLDHLPEKKQRELREIVKVIRAKADVEMIILFGSHARGDWVEDSYVENGVTYEYRSDYDLLVVLDLTRESGRGTKWSAIENRIRRHPGIRTSASIEIQDIQSLNRQLAEGHYFFHDIKQEGVLLYDSGRFTLADARPLDPRERQRLMQDHFDYWFEYGREFLIDCRHALQRGSLAKAAFELNQAAERFYFAAILVFTGYKPKKHDIAALHRQVRGLDDRFLPLFPQRTDFEKAAYRRLREAYISARFDRRYAITREQLEWLLGQVETLGRATEAACRERIASLGER